MLLYRVFAYKPAAAVGTPGHPGYIHGPAQGKGRIDNPDRYTVWYLARDASGAIGEVFGDITEWRNSMFDVPFLAGAKKALGIYQAPDDLSVLNLDHAFALHERGLRPTQIVERNRAATQRWALSVYEECNYKGDQLWSGVEWWSFHRSHWRVMGLWGVTPAALAVDELDLTHPAVVDAAASLRRVI
ncbi:RES family NAD+ phosphorylase [Mycobacterium sp. 1164966.3]|uniref:RES family NAD+ phosphorylase n=1 Tax=Mycobacterium sp. 1164966.3 TaxID=1856861 RepID=UPI0009ED9AA8|nr:RES family NAD+ phosphorylase [Mycobacterium sp. 1164966.3]